MWVCVCISQLLSLRFTRLCHSVVPLHLLLFSSAASLSNPRADSLSLNQTTLIAGCVKCYSLHPSAFTLLPHCHICFIRLYISTNVIRLFTLSLVTLSVLSLILSWLTLLRSLRIPLSGKMSGTQRSSKYICVCTQTRYGCCLELHYLCSNI